MQKILFYKIFVFVLLFGNLSVYAQQNLSKETKRMEVLHKKSNLSDQEIVEFFRLSQKFVNVGHNQTLEHLEKFKQKLIKEKQYKHLPHYCSQVSEWYMYAGKDEKAFEILKDITDSYAQEFDEENRIRVNMMMLRALENQMKYREVLELSEEMLLEAKSEYNKAGIYSIKASALHKQGDFQGTIESLQEALKLYRSINNVENVAVIYNRIGLLKFDMKEFKSALKYYKQGVREAEKNNVGSENLAALYHNMANAYKEIDSLDLAQDYYTKVLDLSKTFNNPMTQASVLLDMGLFYVEKKDFPKAFEHLSKSMRISDSLGIDYGKMYNYNALAYAYQQQGQYGKALEASEKTVVYAQKLNDPKTEFSAYKMLSDLYSKTGNYKKALENHIKFYSLETEIMGEEKQRAVSELEIKYQTEVKDRELERISYENKLQTEQIRMLSFGIVLLLLLIFGIIFFIIYRNRILKDLYQRNVEIINMANIYKIVPEETTNNRSQPKKIFDKLMDLLENEKIFQDPELSIKDVAEKIKTNEKYVSQAISTYANMNYNNFINFYRVNRAKVLFGEMEFANINEIMYACGFNSRTTFYNAFKKFTGLSPKQFKEMGGGVSESLKEEYAEIG